MARYMDENFEKAVLKNADRIITVGKSLKQSFCKKVKGLDEKIEVITNGYDSEDFPVTDRMSPDVFTISYIGTLSDAYPVAVFIDALTDLAKRGFTFRLRFVGSVSSRQQSIIRSKSDSVMTDFLPYVNHEEAVRYMKQSSLLLLIIPDHHSNKSIITGKLFEYLASAKPVLCIGPADGDAAEIICSSGNGRTAEYSNRQGICTIIEEFYNAGAGTELKQPSEFTRENLTRKLAVLLNSKV
jgi:glycosyltransferase involved in cell wall biosynthesis